MTGDGRVSAIGEADGAGSHAYAEPAPVRAGGGRPLARQVNGVVRVGCRPFDTSSRITRLTGVLGEEGVLLEIEETQRCCTASSGRGRRSAAGGSGSTCCAVSSRRRRRKLYDRERQGGVKDAIVPADSCVCATASPSCAISTRPATFINCTNCGRATRSCAPCRTTGETTMAAPEMCGLRAVRRSLDRRYHAQPNACRVRRSSPSPTNGLQATGDAALDAAAARWRRADRVIKASAASTSPSTLRRPRRRGLRWRRRRDAKPFADGATSPRGTHVAQPDAASLADDIPCAADRAGSGDLALYRKRSRAQPNQDHAPRPRAASSRRRPTGLDTSS